MTTTRKKTPAAPKPVNVGGWMVTPSDPTDTTEEAIMALLKVLHDLERAKAADATKRRDAAVAAARNFRAEVIADVAKAIGAGDHWNTTAAQV